MQIIIEYESSWRNSFLDGSNNEPLPKGGRNFIASMTTLKQEGNYKKRQNTTKGTQNRTNRPQHESTLTPAKDKGIKKFIKKLFGFKK